MNVHHLELFYYVAKHGGISAAVRHIPYGIQQPAVSGQMTALEENAGARLFERTPFRLTAAGEKLFAHVQPFFEGLDGVAAELRGGAKPELRIGASELVLRDHIPTVMQRVRARHPKLRLTMRSGYQAQLEAWLRDGLIDLAIGPVDARPPARLRQLRLAWVPLVLLVHRQWPLKQAETLWAQKKIAEPLVGLPAGTSVMKNFQKGLKRRGVTWSQSAEATSIELVTCYVANGEGHGVNLAIPGAIKHRDVRVLALEGFDPMTMGLLWRGEPSELVRAAMAEIQRYAQATWPEWAIADQLP
ncbi:MAG: LysR family transcriptional regulator [Verrucomicrobia bacterium]|nr:LysR family transcriptional regulator [Verrucomicrobiota bacterium]